MRSRIALLFAAILLVAGCSKDDSSTTGPDLTLRAPTDLKATRLGKTVVRLTWKDNTEAEEGFVVERRNGQGLFVPHLFTARDNATAIDSVGLLPDSSYAYRVHALRYIERGEYSDVVTIRLTIPFP